MVSSVSYIRHNLKPTGELWCLTSALPRAGVLPHGGPCASRSRGALLLGLLQDSAAPPRAELLRLVDAWVEENDRSEKLDAEDGCNAMHLLGAALCVLLHRSEEADAAAAFDLSAALGPSSS